MKRFLHAGERYALFQRPSLEAIQYSTDTTLTENKRYINKTTSKAYGLLVRPWFRKAAGLMPVALVCFMARMGRALSRLLTGISSTFSRSPLEAESKPSRRIVEAESNNCRRTVEQVSNKSRRNQASCNLFSIRTSCICLGLFFMCLQAVIAKEPVVPETDRAVLVAFYNSETASTDTTNTSSQEIPRISAGQPLPEEFWTKEFQFYDHEKVYTQTLEQYKGKPIILGLWSIYCGACISSFPLLNESKAKFGDDLVILPVNSYDKDLSIVDKVLGRFDESYRITSIIYDDYLKHLFPHAAVPHYIWIHPSGVVEAVTIKFFLTRDNISKFVEGYGKD